MQESVAPNADQRRGWNGPEGDNWTDNEDWYNDALRFIAPRLIDGAALTGTEGLLDIGCGCGQSTRDAARAVPEGFALGLDLSSRMIERALARAAAERLANVTFEHGDAQIYPFEPAGFDVAISRFGCMFFDDPVAAFANVARAVRDGGRLTLLVWRTFERQRWMVALRDALAAGRDLASPPPTGPSPVAFADPDRVTQVLTGAGFTDVRFDSIDEPMFMGPDADAAYRAIARTSIVKGLTAELDDAARADAMNRLRETVEGHETPRGVLFDASAWLVRARRGA